MKCTFFLQTNRRKKNTDCEINVGCFMNPSVCRMTFVISIKIHAKLYPPTNFFPSCFFFVYTNAKLNLSNFCSSYFHMSLEKRCENFYIYFFNFFFGAFTMDLCFMQRHSLRLSLKYATIYFFFQSSDYLNIFGIQTPTQFLFVEFKKVSIHLVFELCQCLQSITLKLKQKKNEKIC